MGFLNIFDRLRKPSGPSASSGDRSPWGDFFFESASARSGSGMRVSADGALRLAAVYACVRILSETMASLPLVIYQRRPDGGKDRITDHWLYRLMSLFANANRYLHTHWPGLAVLSHCH
jgi:phage portal protein BeeE